MNEEKSVLNAKFCYEIFARIYEKCSWIPLCILTTCVLSYHTFWYSNKDDIHSLVLKSVLLERSKLIKTSGEKPTQNIYVYNSNVYISIHSFVQAQMFTHQEMCYNVRYCVSVLPRSVAFDEFFSKLSQAYSSSITLQATTKRPLNSKTLTRALKKSLAGNINSTVGISRHLIKQLVDGSANHPAQKTTLKLVIKSRRRKDMLSHC